MAELENQIETDVTQQHEADHTKVNPFDAVRDKIKFEGFTDSQKEAILDQYEEAYNAPGGTAARDMIDAGVALPDGFTIYNSNSQSVIEDHAQGQVDAHLLANPGTTFTQAQIDQYKLDQLNDSGRLSSNYAYPGTGQVFIDSCLSL